jgi:hypothetical protein
VEERLSVIGDKIKLKGNKESKQPWLPTSRTLGHNQEIKSGLVEWLEGFTAYLASVRPWVQSLGTPGKPKPKPNKQNKRPNWTIHGIERDEIQVKGKEIN